MQISAYVPCYNNAETIEAALDGILNQTVAVDELFVIDDGSTDDSVRITEEKGVRVIRNEANLGRGAVRNRAVIEARHELLLGCDATNVLHPNFVKTALPHFDSRNVAAAYGRIMERSDASVAIRWRGRHLFKSSTHLIFDRRASLATSGAMLRREHVIKVGNFDSTLRHSEDVDLGKRLPDNGFEVIFDPELQMSAVSKNSLADVLERYWRWHAGRDEGVDFKAYLKQIVYSIKVMAADDLRDKDPLSVPISLLVPHYQFWKSVLGRKQNTTNAVKR